MLCVDDGTFNNEPFELARQTLAGLTGRNPRSGMEAKCAVLMIDPLPEVTNFNKNASEQGILKTLFALIGAWTSNSRFKPEEIALALQESIYSRFIMTPSRRNDGEPQPNPILASGPLSGFAGFLNVKFRHHDYMLGRRNCQRFRQEHFSLPATNPLFANWTATQRDRYAIEKAAGRELPIIPLVGPLRSSAKGGTDQPLPTWPDMSINEAEVKAAISERLTALLNQMLTRKSWLCRTLGSLAIYFVRKHAIKWISKNIASSLKK
jgi:hypothetical protein